MKKKSKDKKIKFEQIRVLSQAKNQENWGKSLSEQSKEQSNKPKPHMA